MARQFNVTITSGTAPGPYNVYYDSVNPSNYASLYSSSLSVTGPL